MTDRTPKRTDRMENQPQAALPADIPADEARGYRKPELHRLGSLSAVQYYQSGSDYDNVRWFDWY